MSHYMYMHCDIHMHTDIELTDKKDFP